MEAINIRSVGDFANAVYKIHETWTQQDPGKIFPWFRGHASESFELLPGLYRMDPEVDDQNYRHDFELKSHPYLAGNSYGTPQNSIEWYFLMQHFGIPTRLLDWTESGLSALHFAVFYCNSKQNACVWVFHPYKFNKLLHEVDQVWIFPKELEEYVPPLWTSKKMPVQPIATQPILKSTRITVQKGQFTLHGSDRTPLEKIKGIGDCFVKLIIPNKCISRVKDELYMHGITESSLFPDLPGLCREITGYYST